MKCLKCGAELQETDLFCPKCGEKVQKGNSNDNDLFTYERPEENAQNSSVEFNTLQDESINQRSNNQQNFNQQSNSQQQNQVNNGGQAPKKKSNTLLIFIIVLLIIIVIITGIAFFFRKVMKSFSEKSMLDTILGSTLEGEENYSQNMSTALLNEILSEEANNENNNTVFNITSGDNNSVKLDKNDAEQVDFGEFRFYIPDNLEYSISDKNLTIKDSSNKWVVGLAITEGDLVDDMQDSSLLRSLAMKLFNAQGGDLKVTNSGTATLNGVDYVLLEGKSGGETPIFAFAKLTQGRMALMSVVASDGNIALSTMSEIIKNAERMRIDD